MPAKSEAQRRYLYATKGAAWVKRHHFDNEGKLPEKTNNRETLKRRFAAALKKLPPVTSDAHPDAESPRRRSK